MTLVHNKKIHFEYTIDEKRVFGIELFGAEVKSLKLGLGSLEGARVAVSESGITLLNSFIPIYQEKNNKDLDAYRTRKLLYKKKDILDLKNLQHGKNLHIYPIGFFTKGRFIKLECGIGTRLKKQDKREVIRKKDEKMRGN